MRASLLAGILLIAGTALPVQAQDNTPVPLPRDTDNTAPTAPVLTQPHPDDIATTTPQAVKPGPDGDTPSDEMPAAGTPPSTAHDPRMPGPSSATLPHPGIPTPATPVDPGAAASAADPATQAPLRRLTAGEAEALLGRQVVSRDGERLGTVRNFQTSGTDGRILAAIIGHGGVLGLGERLVAVPVDALELDPGTAADAKAPLTVALSANEVAALEPFDDRKEATTLVLPSQRKVP